MANVFDAANFFIDICSNRTDTQITNLKLNRLLYYAQGCYLARTGKPLFDENIEAWYCGPIIPDIYKKYKQYDNAVIRSVNDDYNSDIFSVDEIDTLIDVMREFGKYCDEMLADMIYKAGTPWNSAYSNGNTKISHRNMKKYFEKHPVPHGSDAFAKIPAADKLPNDWYDPSEDAEWKTYL